MKRLTALLLTAALLLLTVSASAAPLTEKFSGQVKSQGFKGTVTFSVSGAETAAFTADEWAWLTSALPRLQIEMRHSFSGRRVQTGANENETELRGDGQADLNVLLDEEPLGRTMLLYSDDLAGLSSDFLSGYGEEWYTFARGWNPAQLLVSAAQGNDWPPVWHLLQTAGEQPAEWQDQVNQHLVSFQTKLGAWLNAYAAATAASDENGAYTQLQWIIPAEDVKQETKTLLSDFFGNDGLLALLRQIATPQEAACYLQSGMAPIFMNWVDRLSLAGQIEITRRYGTAGEALLDEIRLPFAKGMPLSSLVISVTPGDGGDTWAFRGEREDGASFFVSCLPGAEQIYSGTVEISLPAADGKDAKQIAFDYNLSWDGGKEVYSLSADRFEQAVQATLVLKPHEGGKPAQSLTLKAMMSSASAIRTPVYLNAELTWRDLDGDAAVTATLTSRTASPADVDKLANQKQTVRLDQLQGSDLQALLNEWRQRASAWLTNAAELLLPKSLPER